MNTVADVEDNWSAENLPRRKSAPNDHQQLLTAAATASVGRSNSFKMPKSTTSRLSPDSAEGSGSKSMPTTPLSELAATHSTEQASASTTGSALATGSTQRAKTAWTRVKDIVTTTARRGSTDALTPGRDVVADGRSSSAERCGVVDDDEADPWIEKRPRSKRSTVSDNRGGRSSVSPPSTSKRHQNRKRFSVSHGTSTSATRTALSNSPLDLAGLLGRSRGRISQKPFL